MGELNLHNVKKTISSVCKDEPAVVAGYLFGSFAKKKEKKQSDIDIALLLNEKKAADFSTLTVMSKLEKDLGCRVDLIILNRVGEILKFEIRRNGILIFERSSDQRKQFEVRSRKYYEDFRYLHRNYINKVLHGEFNGKSHSY